MLEAPQGEQPGQVSDVLFAPGATDCKPVEQHDSGHSGRNKGSMLNSFANSSLTGDYSYTQHAPISFGASSDMVPGWVPGAPPKREQPEHHPSHADAHRPLKLGRTSPTVSSTMSTSSINQPFAEKTSECASQDLPAPQHYTLEHTAAPSAMSHGLFSGEPIARSFGHEGAAKQPPWKDVACKFSQLGSYSCSSPAMPAPACHVPSSHGLVLDTSIQVCTQLRSNILSSFSGITPGLAVQATSPDAVGGPHTLIHSCASVQSFCSVAPNSGSASFATAVPLACAAPFAVAASSSQSNLASATARPPGALLSPVPASTALPVSALFVNSGPSKRRLLFEPGPKLAKRLKLG